MLADVLRGLGADGLTELLQRRPDVIGDAPPGSLTELSERLGSIGSTAAALRQLNRPTLQVAEALAALGGTVSLDRLSQVLGGSPDVELKTLSELFLITMDPDPSLVPILRNFWARPLGLGPSVGWTLAPLTADNLRAIAANLGIALVGTRKSEILREVTSALATPSIVLDAIAQAPAEIQDELRRAAITGEPIETYTYGYYYSSWSYHRKSDADTTDIWGLDRGMLALDPHTDDLVVAAEIALALRGPDYVAPFEPDPPVVPFTMPESTPDGVGTAAAFGRVVTGLLDSLGRRPLTLLKDGRLGVREIARLAKELRSTEPEVRLALAVSAAAGLLSRTAPSTAYDDFLCLAPAERLATLLRAWWTLPTTNHTLIRYAVGRAITTPTALVDWVIWQQPYGYGPAATAQEQVLAAWQEANTIGAVASGQSTLLGAALLDSPDELESILASVGVAQTTVRLQTDLTAVVAGTPAPDLAALLDSAAVLEMRGDAMTWRFTPASVRSALDSGVSADQLLVSLTDVARDGVPQTLDYLIRDVARTHGALRVLPVSSCLRSDDTALLAQVAADRRLSSLGLRLLAPTVLTSSAPPDDLLSALRSAGYAPVLESADGVVNLRPAPAQRTSTAPRRAMPTALPDPVDYAGLVSSLLAAPDRVGSPSTLDGLRRFLTVGRREAEVLARAIDHEEMVQIVYIRQDGQRSVRVISDMVLFLDSITAFCHLRQEERQFKLRNIKAVIPI